MFILAEAQEYAVNDRSECVRSDKLIVVNVYYQRSAGIQHGVPVERLLPAYTAVCQIFEDTDKISIQFFAFHTVSYVTVKVFIVVVTGEV